MASAVVYQIFLLFLLPFLATAQNNGTVSVDATLTAGDESSPPWLSPSGDFAFGFHQLEGKNNADFFLLSIWYSKIPDKTVVWYATKDNFDPAVPRGSQVKLTAEKGLLLNDPQGKQIWRSEFELGVVTYGFMNDTGNFVLASRSSGELWSSFSNPTDTLLPTQMMETRGILYSTQSETNFSRGRFQFRLLEDGNLVLNTANLPTHFAYEAYYISGTHDPASPENSGYRLMFNESGYMYILRRNLRRFALTTERTVSAEDFYHRATLNFDGVFAQYFYPKTGSGNWSVVWSKPDNICVDIRGDIGSGACGFNSICSLNDERRRTCNCPKGYSLLDENDKFGSCKPDFDFGCNERGQGYNKDFYDFFELTDIDWPLADLERFNPYDEVQCKNSCLNDCFCAVAIYRESNCWLKKLPLSNGRVDSRVSRKAFMRYRKPDSRPDSENPKKPNPMNVTVSVLFGSSVFLNFAFVGAFVLVFYSFTRRN